MIELVEATLSLRDGHSKEWASFNKGAKAADQQMGLLNKHVLDFAKGMTVFELGRRAVSGLANFMRSAVTEAMAAKQVSAALGSSMRMMNDTADSKKMLEYYGDLADVLSVNDDRLKAIAASFQTATGVSQAQIAKMMTGAVGLARNTGATVEEVFLSMTQALQTGISRGLKRFGLTLDETAGKAENIGILTAQLRKFEQAAIDAARNGAGQVEGMIEAWKDAKEELGAGFLDTFHNSEGAIRSFGESLREIGRGFGRVFGVALTGFDLVTAGIAKTMGYITGSWAVVQGTLAQGFDSLLVDFQNMATRISGAWNTILAKGELVWEKIKQAFVRFWNWIAGTWVGKELKLGFLHVDEQAEIAAARRVAEAQITMRNVIDDRNRALWERGKERDRQMQQAWEVETGAGEIAADKLAGMAAGMNERLGPDGLPRAPEGGGLTLAAHATDVVSMLQEQALAEEKKTAETEKQKESATSVSSSMQEAARAAQAMAQELAGKITGGKDATLSHSRRSSAEYYEKRAQQEYGKISGRNPEEDARRLKQAQQFEEQARRSRGLGTEADMQAYAGQLQGGAAPAASAPAATGGKTPKRGAASALDKIVDEGVEAAKSILDKLPELVAHIKSIDAILAEAT